MTSSRCLASAGPSGLALASDDAEGTIYLLSGVSMGNPVLASIGAANSIVCGILGLDPWLTLGGAAKSIACVRSVSPCLTTPMLLGCCRQVSSIAKCDGAWECCHLHGLGSH